MHRLMYRSYTLSGQLTAMGVLVALQLLQLTGLPRRPQGHCMSMLVCGLRVTRRGLLLAHAAQVWSQSEAEGAWMNRLGPPEQTAHWICQAPWLRLGRPLFKHLPEQLSGDT
jgi:hypothetical protein